MGYSIMKVATSSGGRGGGGCSASLPLRNVKGPGTSAATALCAPHRPLFDGLGKTSVFVFNLRIFHFGQIGVDGMHVTFTRTSGHFLHGVSRPALRSCVCRQDALHCVCIEDLKKSLALHLEARLMGLACVGKISLNCCTRDD